MSSARSKLAREGRPHEDRLGGVQRDRKGGQDIPYLDKLAAEAATEPLTKSMGRARVLRAAKVPME